MEIHTVREDAGQVIWEHRDEFRAASGIVMYRVPEQRFRLYADWLNAEVIATDSWEYATHS